MSVGFKINILLTFSYMVLYIIEVAPEHFINLSEASNLKSVDLKYKIDNIYCNYCCLKWLDGQITGRVCGKHTMCLYYDSNVFGKSCAGKIETPLSKENKMEILKIHNQLRNKVALGEEKRGAPGSQFSASNMRMMYWDSEMELFAKRWAQQCVNDYDECRDSARFPVGQNIIKTDLIMINDLMIKKWFDEVKYFNNEDVKRPYKFNFQYRNYVQLVWADSYLIGCATIAYQEFRNGQIQYQAMFVCNYGPTGNIPQLSIYSVGNPCENCPKDTTCNEEYLGLCSLTIESNSSLSRQSNKDYELTILSDCISICVSEKLYFITVLVHLYIISIEL